MLSIELLISALLTLTPIKRQSWQNVGRMLCWADWFGYVSHLLAQNFLNYGWFTHQSPCISYDFFALTSLQVDWCSLGARLSLPVLVLHATLRRVTSKEPLMKLGILCWREEIQERRGKDIAT